MPDHKIQQIAELEAIRGQVANLLAHIDETLMRRKLDDDLPDLQENYNWDKLLPKDLNHARKSTHPV